MAVEMINTEKNIINLKNLIMMKSIKSIILIVISIVLSIALSSSDPRHPMPHPDDCRKYLMPNGIGWIEMDCMPGTAYNPLIYACDYPEMVMCDMITGKWLGAGFKRDCYTGTVNLGGVLKVNCELGCNTMSYMTVKKSSTCIYWN